MQMLLRAWLFQFGMVTSLLFFGLLAVPIARFLSFSRAYWFINLWCGWMMLWLKITCNIRYEVKGLENIPDQPVIFVVNHQSTWETLSLTQILPPLTWVVKRELLAIPFFGWGLRRLQPIAIAREQKQALEQLQAQGLARLQAGRSVLIFPEGTRTPVGEIVRYKKGAFRLAAAAQVPIVPIAHNAGCHWPHGTVKKYPGVIQVEILPAILPAGQNSETWQQAVEAVLRPAVARLGADCRE
jgi:1-acyl-sn-glycerol-3-phosphate acyltransferase